jgi:hypothetical protein
MLDPEPDLHETTVDSQHSLQIKIKEIDDRRCVVPELHAFILVLKN